MHPSPSASVHKVGNLLLAGVFLVGISLPLIDTALGVDTSAPLAENRLLATLPPFTWSWQSLAEFRGQFEKYYNDHVGFRKTLIRWHNFIHVKVFGISPIPDVVVGKEGWLYLGHGYTYEYYRAADPLRPDELHRWQQVLEERQAWLATQGIQYVVLIAPEKETIYPEFMPDRINRVHAESALDQLLAHMRAHSQVPILDLRGVLWAAKNHQRLYSRLDSHWNDYGAFLAYQQIMNRLSTMFPQLHAAPLSDFEPSSLRTYTPGIGFLGTAQMLSLADWLPSDEYLQLIPRTPRRAKLVTDNGVRRQMEFTDTLLPRSAMEVADATLPRAVMIRDSFSVGLFPFLSEHFQRIVYHWGSLEFPRSLIIDEHPNVVIQEMAERYLLPRWIPQESPKDAELAVRLAYENATDIRLTLDAQHGYAGMAAIKDVVVLPAKEEVILRSNNIDPIVLLPAFPFSPNTTLLCRLEITSPENTPLQVFYMTTSEPQYTGDRVVTKMLNKGHNVIAFALPTGNLTGQLRLDPGNFAGDYTLHSLQIRAVPVQTLAQNVNQ